MRERERESGCMRERVWCWAGNFVCVSVCLIVGVCLCVCGWVGEIMSHVCVCVCFSVCLCVFPVKEYVCARFPLSRLCMCFSVCLCVFPVKEYVYARFPLSHLCVCVCFQ